MDKLTIEEKAKRYDGAIDKAKKELDACGSQDCDAARQIFRLFPEIKESGDERIRKFLHHTFTVQYLAQDELGKWHGEPVSNILAWLEKQGEPVEINPTEFDTRLQSLIGKFDSLPKEELIGSLSFWLNVVQNDGTYKKEKQGEVPVTINIDKMVEDYANNEECDNEGFGKPVNCMIRAYRQGLTDAIVILNLRKQGEQNLIMAKSPQLGKQKPANNNELKFKIGDWVVVDGITQKVTHIQTDGFDTDRAWNGKSTFNDVHLWTIADVKDCDVLVDVYGNVGIYKSHDDFSWLSYCSLGYYGGFQHFTIEHDNEKTYPATKEQRERFFAAMNDAGWEFDFEKKELKKISQRMISAEAKEAMYGKPAWSEEDERIFRTIISDGIRGAEFDMLQINWLKSLKQRIKL